MAPQGSRTLLAAIATAAIVLLALWAAPGIGHLAPQGGAPGPSASGPSHLGSAVVPAILPPPQVVLTPTSGTVGSMVTVSGTNFTASTNTSPRYVTVTFGPNGEFLCDAATDLVGNFSCDFAVPEAVHGPHNVTATDVLGLTTAANFSVNASASLTPTSGLPGDSATVTGTGFAGNDSIKVTWSPIPNALCTVNSTNVGSFSCDITIPASSQSVHTITVQDTGGNSTTLTFGLAPTVSVQFTNHFDLYMAVPVTLDWTITSSASITTTDTDMSLVVSDLGSSACPYIVLNGLNQPVGTVAPPCVVTTISLDYLLQNGTTGYSTTLSLANLTVDHYNGGNLPFNTEYGIAVEVTVTDNGVAETGGATQNVYLQTYLPSAGLVAPSPLSAASTGNITVAVNYSGDFVTGAKVSIFNATNLLVFTSGVATAGAGAHVGYATTPWLASVAGSYSAVINLTGPFGFALFTVPLKIVPAGVTVYINGTTYHNDTLFKGLAASTTATILLVVGVIVGLVVALLLGRMVWANAKPSSPQPWSSASSDKSKLKPNECPACHQQFASETELADHTKKEHGGQK